MRVKFYDNNGEPALGYRVERRVDGGEWQEIKFLKVFENYTPGKVGYMSDYDMPGGLQEYRFIGVDKKGNESICSRVCGIKVPYSGVGGVVSENGLEIKVEKGRIIIHAESEGRLQIYGADGITASEVEYLQGDNYVENLAPGLYIINSAKYLVF